MANVLKLALVRFGWCSSLDGHQRALKFTKFQGKLQFKRHWDSTSGGFNTWRSP